MNSNTQDKPIDLIYHYLFNVLVFQFRVMDIPYFMDSCSLWELSDILDNLPYLDRNLWETARLNAFINAQTHSRKTLSFTDICKFKWEDNESSTNTEISNADIDRLKAKAKIIESQLRNEHIQN